MPQFQKFQALGEFVMNDILCNFQLLYFFGGQKHTKKQKQKQKKTTKRFSNHVSHLLLRSHTFAIIVILDLKIHQSMWIH